MERSAIRAWNHATSLLQIHRVKKTNLRKTLARQSITSRGGSFRKKLNSRPHSGKDDENVELGGAYINIEGAYINR